ncbi:MAG: hypothetical protein ACYDB2_02730 [Acidimicrobiales bacterium]
MGVYAADGVDGAGLAALSKALASVGVDVTIIAPHVGTIKSEGKPVAVNKTALVTQSVDYGALVVAGGKGAEAFAHDSYIAMNLAEVLRHYTPIAPWGAGVAIVDACGISEDSAGVVVAKSFTRAFCVALIEASGWHRYWQRDERSQPPKANDYGPA